MSAYCLDTDFIIDVLRDDPDARALLRDVEARDRPYISAITAFEATDVPGKRRRAIALDALGAFEILPVDGSVALAASRMSIELGSAGRDVPMPDLLIAATCALRGLTLVTRNAKHFGRIRGLKTVSW